MIEPLDIEKWVTVIKAVEAADIAMMAVVKALQAVDDDRWRAWSRAQSELIAPFQPPEVDNEPG